MKFFLMQTRRTNTIASALQVLTPAMVQVKAVDSVVLAVSAALTAEWTLI
jgi:hypothetical protein